MVEDKKQRDTGQAGFHEDAPKPDDKNLPENSKENLDRKLDEAIEETFPTSDPVSVKITK